LFGVCFSTEVIIYGKGGQKDPQWTVWKVVAQSIEKLFFFEALVMGTTFSTTTFSTFAGSGVGSGAGAGCS